MKATKRLKATEALKAADATEALEATEGRKLQISSSLSEALLGGHSHPLYQLSCREVVRE